MSNPTVFVSYAGTDRNMAYRLTDDLGAYRIGTFNDVRDLQLGEYQVSELAAQMAKADYCILLWSRHSADRPWVKLERNMAMHRELTDGRTFLFIIRLDDTDLPLELRVRRYVDGHHDWQAAVRAVAGHIRGDRAAGTPVYPPPDGHDPSVRSVLIRNRALQLTHVVGIPPAADPLAVVRATLRLPESRSEFGGKLVLEFSYRLLYEDEPLANGHHLKEGQVIDLEVTYRASDLKGPLGSERIYRTDPINSGPTDVDIRAACYRAFKYLRP